MSILRDFRGQGITLSFRSVWCACLGGARHMCAPTCGGPRLMAAVFLIAFYSTQRDRTSPLHLPDAASRAGQLAPGTSPTSQTLRLGVGSDVHLALTRPLRCSCLVRFAHACLASMLLHQPFPPTSMLWLLKAETCRKMAICLPQLMKQGWSIISS